MQGDAKRELAKNDQISIAWLGLSLLKEQGSYAFLAGTSATLRSRIGIDASPPGTSVLCGRRRVSR